MVKLALRDLQCGLFIAFLSDEPFLWNGFELQRERYASLESKLSYHRQIFVLAQSKLCPHRVKFLSSRSQAFVTPRQNFVTAIDVCSGSAGAAQEEVDCSG